MSATRAAVIHGDRSPEDFHRGIDVATRLKQVEPELLVRVILNGKAVAGAVSTERLDLVDGVSVEVCQVALDKQGFSRDDVRPGVGVVPMAAHAILDAQFAGAAYLRL